MNGSLKQLGLTRTVRKYERVKEREPIPNGVLAIKQGLHHVNDATKIGYINDNRILHNSAKTNISQKHAPEKHMKANGELHAVDRDCGATGVEKHEDIASDATLDSNGLHSNDSEVDGLNICFYKLKSPSVQALVAYSAISNMSLEVHQSPSVQSLVAYSAISNMSLEVHECSL
ncbi:hypothetical protein DPMN_011911 [Dreissena polymorpha]|uniref:Uncharacterized protein n=1 Tax=Dreissena polymorpha TaxID=45954 RepID=A0A9D4N601_DREPO|nr:hypothetical protein DPMN_011911 [Dreissena polymorpha]